MALARFPDLYRTSVLYGDGADGGPAAARFHQGSGKRVGKRLDAVAADLAGHVRQFQILPDWLQNAFFRFAEHGFPYRHRLRGGGAFQPSFVAARNIGSSAK